MSEQITLSITGMTCPHCVTRAQKALAAVDGVSEAIVTLDTQSAVVKGEVGAKDLIAAIEQAGYTAQLA